MTRPAAAAAAVPPGPAVPTVLAGLRHLVPSPAAGHVAIYHDWQEFLASIESQRPGMVVIEATLSAFDLDGFDALRTRLPRTPVVVMVPPDPAGLRMGVALVRLGADGVVATSATHPDTHELARVLEEAVARRVTQFALDAIGANVPAPLCAFLGRLWVRCRRPLAPDDAARVYHRHPATLGRHLRRAGLPSLSRLVVWGRLLHAAHLLEEPARPVANVAAVLGFPSQAALCNQLARYAGLTPSDLRSEGLALVAGEFARRSQMGEWTLRRPTGSSRGVGRCPGSLTPDRAG